MGTKTKRGEGSASQVDKWSFQSGHSVHPEGQVLHGHAKVAQSSLPLRRYVCLFVCHACFVCVFVSFFQFLSLIFLRGLLVSWSDGFFHLEPDYHHGNGESHPLIIQPDIYSIIPSSEGLLP